MARGASLDPDLTQGRKMHYSLSVVALDGAPGESQLHAAVTVNITILDVNNKSPTFQEPGTIVIKENVPVRALIVLHIPQKILKYIFRWVLLFPELKQRI